MEADEVASPIQVPLARAATPGPAVAPAADATNNLSTANHSTAEGKVTEGLADLTGLASEVGDIEQAPRVYWVRHLWRPLEPFFRLHGYDLFVRTPDDEYPGLVPKKEDELRARDQFHAMVEDTQRVKAFIAPAGFNKCCPATRLRDGKHVMLQLVMKAGEGATELETLRRFSRPDIAYHPDNHVLPLLDELTCLDMVFAIVPLLADDLINPWYYDLGEALDAVAQTFKGLAFMHSHLVAHLDIGCRDILMNFGGLWGRRQYSQATQAAVPFRSRFSSPCRYTFIDFEVSTIFPYGMSAEDHLPSGVHFYDRGRLATPTSYGKRMPPEWLTAEEFCVYKSDVYQMGKMWEDHLELVRPHLPGLFDMIDSMTHANPAERPTMAQASARLQGLIHTCNGDTLKMPLWPLRPSI